MVIKPHKELIYLTLFSIGMNFVYVTLSYVVGMLLFSIPVSIIWGVLTINLWIALGRTITLDEDAFSIEFLWYKKCYKWEELKVKQEIVHRNDIRFRIPYTKGIVFSTRYIHKPKWLDPVKYNIYFRPFSFIFLKYSSEKNLVDFDNYYIDENEIKDKLKKWNVNWGE